LVNTYDRMTTLVLQGCDVGTMTTSLAQLVGRSVTVFDPTLQPLAQHDPVATDGLSSDVYQGSESLLRQALAALPDGRRPIRLPLASGGRIDAVSCVLAPIVGGSAEILGYVMLVAGNEEGGDEQIDLLAAQHAATMYALVLMRQRIAADVGNKLRGDLVEGLLNGQMGNSQDASERAGFLGLEVGMPYRVIIMLVAGLESGAEPPHDPPRALSLRRHVLEVLAEFVMTRFPGGVAVARQHDLVVIAPDSEADGARPAVRARELGQATVGHLQRLFPSLDLIVGIGSTCRDATAIADSYLQARRAVGAAQRFGRVGQVTGIEDLGILRLLFQVSDPDELSAFAEAILGPLLAYDRLHDAELLRTLEVYLRHNASVQNAARELFLHPNTVSYRLQRIEKIGGFELANNDVRLSAQIALKILDAVAPRPD
jgi:sugar diacid utilization regulator